MGSSREKLDDKLDSIDPTKTSYQIIKNIDNDEKYFSKDGKAEFDKLSIDDMRNKKVYYESGYKLTKGETESDLTKYLGGKADHENLINNIKDVLKSYKLMFLLTALTVVVATCTGVQTPQIINILKTSQTILAKNPAEANPWISLSPFSILMKLLTQINAAKARIKNVPCILPNISFFVSTKIRIAPSTNETIIIPVATHKNILWAFLIFDNIF